MAGFSPGDVVLGRLTVNGVDVRPRVTKFSVFEHVMKPYSSMVIDFADSADLMNRVFTRANDQVEVSFGQPGQDPYANQFAVMSVERAKSLENLRAGLYTAICYSRHMTRFPRVQKAYREMTATGIVESIISEFLTPDKPVSVRDPSKGILGDSRMPWNVNGVQVHKAIRGALAAAVSPSNASSMYVLYEDRDAMVVDSIERMLDSALASPLFTYYQRPAGQDWLRDQAMQNFSILSMRADVRSDRSDHFQVTNQQVNPFDVFSGQNIRTNVGQKTLISTIANVLYNSMRPPTTVAQAAAPKRYLASELDSQNLTIQVPLNVELTAGRGVGVNFLAPAGDTSTAVLDSLAGPMLITELRHEVDLRKRSMMGTTTVMGSRGGKS